jgi:hypothetical protein
MMAFLMSWYIIQCKLVGAALGVVDEALVLH